MTTTNKNKKLEEFKYLIDSREKSDKKKKYSDTILKARAERFEKRSDNDVKMAKLLQLKLLMEEYLESPKILKEYSFTKFLTMYVDTLYDKRKNFANDISIKPLMLSQVINNHREPQEQFMLRLIVHSEAIFKSFGEFDPKTWYRIYYKEKVGKIISKRNTWRKSVEKFVVNEKIVPYNP